MPDKDAYSGQLVSSTSTERVDPSTGDTIRTTRTVISLGRQDRQTPDPPQPGSPLGPEPAAAWEKPAGLQSAIAATKAAAIARHAALQVRLVAYLREHGPSSPHVLAAEHGVDYHTMLSHLRRREGRVYVRLGKVSVQGLSPIHSASGKHSKAVVWGLAQGDAP